MSFVAQVLGYVLFQSELCRRRRCHHHHHHYMKRQRSNCSAFLKATKSKRNPQTNQASKPTTRPSTTTTHPTTQPPEDKLEDRENQSQGECIPKVDNVPEPRIGLSQCLSVGETTPYPVRDWTENANQTDPEAEMKGMRHNSSIDPILLTWIIFTQ